MVWGMVCMEKANPFTSLSKLNTINNGLLQQRGQTPYLTISWQKLCSLSNRVGYRRLP